MKKLILAIPLVLFTWTSTGTAVGANIWHPDYRFDRERSEKFIMQVLKKCKKGDILKAYVLHSFEDPANFSTRFCDFDKQIVTAPYPGHPSVYTLACIYRGRN